jgi:hypothetical protein
MAEFNINSLLGNRGTTSATPTNFDSLLNLARGQLDNISKEVQSLINQASFNGRSVLLDATGVKIPLPQLSNLVAGQQEVFLKSAFPLDKGQNFNVQVQNSNVVLSGGQPVLRLEGQIVQNNVQLSNPALQRFTAEIPLSSLNNQNLQAAAQGNLNTADQVVRNFLPNAQLNAFTNNLSETLRSLLPQNLQSLNLQAQNNLSLQINSITTPSGQQINVNNAAGNNLVVQGQVEVFPDANEALIRTEFGTFRVNNLTNIPNGSNINFTIQGQAEGPTAQNINNLLNLNPTNLQTLRLSLEATDSPIQNLLKILNSTQGLGPLVQRYFPHPDDKAAYARQLMFLSGAAQGNPEGWLGDEGQMIINKLHESDTNLNRLQEVFSVLKNFSGHGEQKTNLEWNSYIIPLYDGNKLSFATVQVQRDPEGGNGQNFKGKRKFILELEQDDLGRVAIEGLYSNNQGKVNNMDIILKTEKPVDEGFMQELSAIFNETALAYNFNGSLTFAPFTAPSPLYTDISKILGDGIII